MNNNNRNWIIAGIVIVGLVVVCCCCALILGGTGLLINRSSRTIIGQPTAYLLGPSITEEPVLTPSFSEPTSPGEEVTSTPVPPEAGSTPRPGTTPAPSSENTTLKDLEQAEVPVSSLIDLAERLKGVTDIPVTETPPAKPFKQGDTEKFWASNGETSDSFQVDATLRFVSPHLYFWIENGVNYNQGDLDQLGNTFESKIYPTDRKFFGSEWSPGVDDDAHLYILFARGLGSGTAGYYSSVDEYDTKAHPYSNEHEMFYVNADGQSLNDPFLYGVLAHEFQHMIHWNRDRNEEAWINEGFSELAMFLNNYYESSPAMDYISDPNIQLNDWPNDPSPVAHSPNYGGSFLFLDYFLSRFGDKVTQDLVGDQENGMVSVDNILTTDKVTDKASGKPVTADDVFADWAVANYLQDPSVADGRYAYSNFTDAPQANDSQRITRCPATDQKGTVHQYGVVYIGIQCKGTFTLDFSGNTQVPILSVEPHSGAYEFWSNMGDESDMTLTRSFDFTKVSGPLTLQYSTWYDIEQDYDYAYVEAKPEGGEWQILKAPHETQSNPNGASYGWAYTGPSKNWVQEQVDLSQFAGKKVDIRFEYVTDAEINGDGMVLDDISIPQIDYKTDFEQDNGGWQAAGFARIQNSLPQNFRISLILKGNKTTVQPVTLDADGKASLPITIGGDVSEAVLVVSGTTRFTRQQASYQFSLQR
jgi:immune inhibitor A